MPSWLIGKCWRMEESEYREAPWSQWGDPIAPIFHTAGEKENSWGQPGPNSSFILILTNFLSFLFFFNFIIHMCFWWKKKKQEQIIQKLMEKIVKIPFNCPAIPFTSPEITAVKSVLCVHLPRHFIGIYNNLLWSRQVDEKPEHSNHTINYEEV